MSNHIIDMIKENYDWITNISKEKFQDKSVILIGTGLMAKEYAIALTQMNISDVTVISKNDKETTDFSNSFDFSVLHGGYQQYLPNLKKADLVIIVTPIPQLLDAAKLAIDSGQKKILIEKPGSLYPDKLTSLSKQLTDQIVRIGYNRLLYPSFHKLKFLAEQEGGITSCTFNFTEWVHTINFEKYPSDVYSRWGISNSLHVISMAMELIGMPKNISTYSSGKLDWHPSGSIFVGSGLSENNIPFSFHADWGSAGRWGVEIMTKDNVYRLIPLEGLFVCKKGSVNWEPISLSPMYPKAKTGIAEEIAVMFNDEKEKEIGLITLEAASEYNKLAEKIFAYT
ncbi:MAG: myo-inositol 2-dehydrogenase [Thaumarchaeota archaeon]|nr:MAG: myo-inositol 2-dehydrogenase [Nitrososphaerota archaeon]